MRVLVGTSNLGKQKEFKELLQTVVDKMEFPSDDTNDIEEYGKTFAQNALIKAQTLDSQSFDYVISDDSGLQIKYLDGFPGVSSNRWFEGSDKDRSQALLDLLKEKNLSNTEACFTTVLCLYDPKTESATFFTGNITGTIAEHQSGTAGFGYDPIFIPKGYSETFAKLGINKKNELSHRSIALKKLRTYLLQIGKTHVHTVKTHAQ